MFSTQLLKRQWSEQVNIAVGNPNFYSEDAQLKSLVLTVKTAI
jgi:hypothetical protein